MPIVKPSQVLREAAEHHAQLAVGEWIDGSSTAHTKTLQPLTDAARKRLERAITGQMLAYLREQMIQLFMDASARAVRHAETAQTGRYTPVPKAPELCLRYEAEGYRCDRPRGHKGRCRFAKMGGEHA